MKISHLAILFLSGCATTRIVTIRPGKGGVIAVFPPHDPEIRQQAEALMSENCQGKGFEIVEEGEAVVGSSTRTSGSVSKFGTGASINASSNSHNQTEWRLTYECKK